MRGMSKPANILVKIADRGGTESSCHNNIGFQKCTEQSALAVFLNVVVGYDVILTYVVMLYLKAPANFHSNTKLSLHTCH